MNYSRDIERCIDYIEEHIKEPLTADDICAVAGYSLFHFSRVFSLTRGMPIMEYVRSRRLSRASMELFSGRRIIDIALDYGFETQSGFAKAFRKAYGYSPSDYTARMESFRPSLPPGLIGDYMPEPAVVHRPAFRVAGYGIETDVAARGYTQEVASFWSRYDGDNLESKMYAILQPLRHGEVGLCIPASGDGYAKYLLGVIVEDFGKVTADMLTTEVPRAQYAVFTTPPVDTSGDAGQDDFVQVIQSTWVYIFEAWFPSSGYVYDEDKPNFEFYDERCHSRADTVMEIYVPVLIRAGD
ncbi:AraC family transcriptional regulator ['Paenibacillus yunnanensis' Narsing Rao et al. 2020]|uniref:AraC family transcriptional regulator n=1 Tax=Paenibacillus tengchongensis TaxID=2608684 RepID=UPI00124D06F7|nr:AraC family transcriptional regulator [Paenibacillus tengchongensis]